MAFEENVVMEETIQVISDIASERGDARYAIELLWRSGKQADSTQVEHVVPDYARQAKADTHPELRKEVFSTLSQMHRILLLDILKFGNGYKTLHHMELSTQNDQEVDRGVKPHSLDFLMYLQKCLNILLQVY